MMAHPSRRRGSASYDVSERMSGARHPSRREALMRDPSSIPPPYPSQHASTLFYFACQHPLSSFAVPTHMRFITASNSPPTHPNHAPLTCHCRRTELIQALVDFLAAIEGDAQHANPPPDNRTPNSALSRMPTHRYEKTEGDSIDECYICLQVSAPASCAPRHHLVSRATSRCFVHEYSAFTIVRRHPRLQAGYELSQAARRL